MFSESLLDSSWAERGRRSWTTLTSFALQAVILGCLMMIPLLTTVGLPLARTVSTPISVRSSSPAPHPQEGGRGSGFRILPFTARIVAPGHRGINHGPDRAEQPVAPGVGHDLGSYFSSFSSGAALPIPINGTHPVIPVAPKSVEKLFRKSEILEGSLIRKVEPKYPPLAVKARIQGPVVLEAVISKSGTIKNLRLVSGHPLLAGAAIDAVSQWRYRPYILNGDVIEVETEITVNFVLGR